MARKKIKIGKIKAEFQKANDVTCECIEQVTPRIGTDCQCFSTPTKSGELPIAIKTETAKLLKVDKLQI